MPAKIAAVATEVCKAVVKMVEDALESVNQAIQNLEKSAAEAGQSIVNAANNPIGALKNALDSAKDSLLELGKAFKDPRNVARAIEVGAQIAPQGVEMYGNIIQGMASQAIAQILKDIGQLQAAEDTLEALIQLC